MNPTANDSWQSMTTTFRVQLPQPGTRSEPEPSPSAEHANKGDCNDSELEVADAAEDATTNNIDQDTCVPAPYRPFLVLNFDTTSGRKSRFGAAPSSGSPEALSSIPAKERWHARRPAACNDCRTSRVRCHHDVEWTPAGIVLPEEMDFLARTVPDSPSAPSEPHLASRTEQSVKTIRYRWINSSAVHDLPGYLIRHEFADEPIPWQYMADQVNGEESGEQAMIIPGTPVGPRVVGDEGYTGLAQRNAWDGDRLVQLGTSRSDSGQGVRQPFERMSTMIDWDTAANLAVIDPARLMPDQLAAVGLYVQNDSGPTIETRFI